MPLRAWGLDGNVVVENTIILLQDEIRAKHDACNLSFEISRAGLSQALSMTLVSLSRGSGEWND